MPGRRLTTVGQPGSIEISAGEDEREWWIRVGDTGPGLPPKAREHLFSAFQGGARKGGTGLGLAISAELDPRPRRRLELARTDAEGTEFVIHLPKDTDHARTVIWPLHCQSAKAKRPLNADP
jgi:signal transduction histidine kinase